MPNLKQYKILIFALIAVVSVFVYFVWQVRAKRYTQDDYENDIKISQALGLDCKKFEVSDMIGKSRAELDRWADLRNSVLIKGEAGQIKSTNQDPEFTKELQARLGEGKGDSKSLAAAESGDRIETQTYTACGLKFVAVLYGDKIVDAVFIHKDHKGRRLFGIEQ